jgi:hypothetical protein
MSRWPAQAIRQCRGFSIDGCNVCAIARVAAASAVERHFVAEQVRRKREAAK